MTCAIVAAMAGSPVFSPSHAGPLSCKPSSETLTLAMGEISPLPSPSSPFRPRPPKLNIGLRNKAASFAPDDACSTSSSSVTVLKRKRPARIHIPAVLPVSWGSGKDVLEEEGEGYSVYCKRGRKREQMEDRYAAVVDTHGNSGMAFFGVFDGHGGPKVAEYVSKNLKKHVMDGLAKARTGAIEVEEAVKIAYHSMDSDLCEHALSGGACSVTALIKNGELIVSNAGDCRAVMSLGGTAEAITSDHRPSQQDERERIEQLGGIVERYHGVWRLQGSLAVSRGFGDVHLKQWVTAEPETRILKLKPDCEFLILASDGLWDKVTNQEAVDIARPLCLNKSELLLPCKSLVDLSVSRGSVDDVSVMIIQLRHFGSNRF